MGLLRYPSVGEARGSDLFGGECLHETSSRGFLFLNFRGEPVWDTTVGISCMGVVLGNFLQTSLGRTSLGTLMCDSLPWNNLRPPGGNLCGESMLVITLGTPCWNPWCAFVALHWEHPVRIGLCAIWTSWGRILWDR
jgi:hypothetical protein